MKVFKSKISQFIVIVFFAILIISVSAWIASINRGKPVSINNKHKLESIYKGSDKFLDELVSCAFLLPYELISGAIYSPSVYWDDEFYYNDGLYFEGTFDLFAPAGSIGSENSTNSTMKDPMSSSTSDGSNLDFSTTNVQVENVDEADIIKTDGQYTYSLSGNEVIITDVRNPESPEIVNRISSMSVVPIDLMLYDNYLIVINQLARDSFVTNVKIYDITNKASVKVKKNYTLKQKYYTSRIVDGNFYMVASGMLSGENGDPTTTYQEDNEEKEYDYKQMYYFRDKESEYQTVVSHISLQNLDISTFDVKSYFADVDYVYVSEKNIYLADRRYETGELNKAISQIFGFKGIWGFSYDNIEPGYELDIIKLKIMENGDVKFVSKGSVKGDAVDQFSFDEYDSNLRVAVQTGDKGSKIVVFNKDMKKIGESKYVGEDETMYSSRFIGERAYLVTYRTVDPLFVFDLSDPKSPKALGNLEISGYSTYLHPYDENHLIGIGIQTKEEVQRNDLGEIIRTTSYITGMKMALFDVSDVNDPKQISEVTTGNRYTKSAILQDHKALLFSKEKGIIAIPINSYTEEIVYNRIETDNVENIVKAYNHQYEDAYITEGYLVYNIDLEKGLTKKGVIKHNQNKYGRISNMIRGLYIKDNLVTISEHMLKVNKLDTLEEISNTQI